MVKTNTFKLVSPRYGFSAEDTVFKVYNSRYVYVRDIMVSYWYDSVDEKALWLDESVNEWLTENCVGLWGIYLEKILVPHYQFLTLPSDIAILMRTYFGFQNQDDAILFRLTF